MEMNNGANIVDGAAELLSGGVDDGTKTQIKALFKAGLNIETIATSLGVTELDVKQVIIGDIDGCGANGEIDFTPGELTLVKAQILRLATNASSEAIALKAATWIADKHTVSKETRFRAAHGMKDSAAGNVNNIMIAINEAKAKAAQHS